MLKLIFSILCLIISAVLVFSAGSAVLNGGADSPWSAILLGANKKGLTELLTERANLNQALANADRIKNKIIDLQKIESSINSANLDKLNKFIPSHVDNVNLLIDINNIAAKQGMMIKNIKVRSTADLSNPTGSTLSGPNGILPTYMSFSVAGDYQTLTSFLDDLANSLRVIDPVSLSFSVDEKGLNQYNFEIRTYWVK